MTATQVRTDFHSGSFLDLGQFPDGTPAGADLVKLEEAMCRVWEATYWDDENPTFEEWDEWKRDHPDAEEGTGLAGVTRRLPCVSEEDAALVEQAHTLIFEQASQASAWDEFLVVLLRTLRLLNQVRTSFMPLYRAVDETHSLIWEEVGLIAARIAA